ncbi:MAG: class I SAM-dependent DNA methyltransferase [Planctomycetota bacterium]|nr:class I SAM-dependent DNA methyltransferase [Planctomycetota bacterium]
MARAAKSSKSKSAARDSSASIGFEAKLWLMADKLRNNMDAAEYKHVVLGLIFLKYISDSFEEHRAKLLSGKGDYAGANPEDPDEYRAENVFWVPSEARWSHLQANAKQPSIGKLADDAMVAIERDNPRLKGVLPKDYARPALDKQRLGELIDLIATINLIASNQPSPNPSPSGRGRSAAEGEGSVQGRSAAEGEGSAQGSSEADGEGAQPTHRSVDLLGRVYEYFLTRFASAEGKNGGQFYTPSCVVRCLVEMLAPYKGRIYDPACGSGGMFVQSEKFVESHGGKIGDISIYGQESNPTTRRLAVMNLAIRGIEADFGPEHADTFRRDLHPDLRADYVLANPPFNDSDWFRKDDDVRWQFGVPPKGNANFAWVQHFIHHLAPSGYAGFVLANGSMSSNQSGEGEIRRAMIEADLVDCMVAMPGQLFYSTQIPVCLWFLTRDKGRGQPSARPSPRGRGRGAEEVGAGVRGGRGAEGVGSGDGRGRGVEEVGFGIRGGAGGGFRDRRGQTLFIDARKMGTLVDRVHRDLTDADLDRITSTYHAWREAKPATPYADVAGFCKSATTAEIAGHGFVLTPGRYVGAEEVEDDGEPFDAKMKRLVAELEGQFAESARLEAAIRANLRGMGYGG